MGYKSHSDIMKEFEEDIVNALVGLGFLKKDFTGFMIIHFNEGGISDYEKHEKGLKKKIK